MEENMNQNPVMESLDLGDIQDNILGVAVLNVRHPQTGKLTGATITLYGPDSTESQELDAKLSDKRLQRIQQRGGQKISSTELNEMMLEKLVGLTREISNFFVKGEVYASTKTNIYSLYHGNPWLREQVQDFLEDRRNFFKES